MYIQEGAALRRITIPFILLGILFGCAGAPVRPTLREDNRIPPGKIEGNRFTGIRYPFTVSFPPHWTVTTEFPEFLVALGYDRPSQANAEQTELYAFDPETKTNIQFDFTPAAPYATFTQEKIQLLAGAGTESLLSELEQDHGKNIADLEIGPTIPVPLQGVPFAAKKHVTYTLAGVPREQGWVYGFSEPYQIFILYMIVGMEAANDREEINRILDSFRFLPDRTSPSPSE